MLARVSSVGLVAVIVVTGLITAVPKQTTATYTSGTFTLDPGETVYVSFGESAVNDVLLWDVYVDTLSTAFTDWLQAPSGIHTDLMYDTWGRVVDSAGEWKLGFSIDSSGFWSATVTYTVINVQPSIDIVSPVAGSYVNTKTLVVSGTTDFWADSVRVSTDEVHYEYADLYMGEWNRQMTLGADGDYTLYAEAQINWSSYWVKYYDSVTFTLDTLPPELLLTSPAAESYVAGTVEMTWQCSDNNGIAKREVKIGPTLWDAGTTDTYTTEVENGYHWVGVQITDVAGNTAFAEVRIFSDDVDPEVYIQQPELNAKISNDHVNVTWTGHDSMSGLDHYEVQITGGQWIDVGTATSYEFTGLDDTWYSVNVKAVDKSGNAATSTVGFGIYTSIWSQNGPYNGIPLYALIVAIVAVVVLSVLLFWRKRKGSPAEVSVPKEEPSAHAP